MKKSVIAILAVCTLFAAAPLFAEGTMTSHPQGAPGSQVMTPDQKNECLLYSKKCMSSADSIQSKMRKLDAEIQKGTKVYTPEELRRLEEKLKDLNDTLDVMMKNP